MWFILAGVIFVIVGGYYLLTAYEDPMQFALIYIAVFGFATLGLWLWGKGAGVTEWLTTLFLGFCVLCVIIGFLVTLRVSPEQQARTEDIRSLLHKKYSPDMNRYQANRENMAAQARVAHLEALNKEAAQLSQFLVTQKTVAETKILEMIQGETLADTLRHQQEVDWANRDLAIFEARARQQLIAKAAEHGLSVGTYEALVVEASKVAAQVMLANIGLQQELAKSREYQQIELQGKQQLHDIEIAALDRVQLGEYRHVEGLTQSLVTLRKEAYAIAQSDLPPEIKEPVLKRYKKNVQSLERDLDGRQKGLIQAHKR